jgi:hypothetical protein
MIASLVRAAAVLASLAALGTGARVMRMPLDRPGAPRSSPPPVAEPRYGRVVADSILLLAGRAAPFRLRRVQPAVRYDPARLPESQSAAPPAPKPVLLLRGLVWAASPAAVIEGIPGIEGARSVLAGDTLGGLSIRRITATSVIVTGFDTTWTLTVKEDPQ